MNISLTPAWVRGNHVIRTIDGETPGVEPATSLATVGVARLPSDPIGSYSLTLSNVVIGSAIQVETQAGALIEFRVADASTEVFSIPAYVAGNPANSLRIKVRKGSSAPYYLPYETLAVAIVGSASIFVSQIPD